MAFCFTFGKNSIINMKAVVVYEYHFEARADVSKVWWAKYGGVTLKINPFKLHK